MSIFNEQFNDTAVESKPEQDTDRVISIDSNEAEDEDDDNEHSTGEQLPQPQVDSPQLRRSTKTRQLPMYYGHGCIESGEIRLSIEAHGQILLYRR